MSRLLNVLVDETPVSVALGHTIMQTCAAAAVEIPRFCYHDKLLIAGNCRICLVEIAGSKKLVAACAVPATNNMIIYSNTVRVRLARQNVLEFLLANHPLDCPICDQGGECDLQDITAVFGADRGRFYETEKRAVLNKDFGPLIRTSMNRCIHCTRCVRFLAVSSGFAVLGTVGRGSSTEISTYVNQFIADELSGNITDLCPVGALTSKPYSFRARPWELVSVESFDTFDTVNSHISLDIVANRVSRVLPYANDALNECWLSNRARYAYDGLFVQRLSVCLLRISVNLFIATASLRVTREFYVKLSWSSAASVVASKLAHPSLISIFSTVGDTFDLSSTLAAKTFFGLIGASLLTTERNQPAAADFNFLYLFNTSLTKLAKFPSFCLLIGVNPRFEAPVLNLRINKLVNSYEIPIYRIGTSASYLAYKTRYLSSNLASFFQVAEFKHVFCKNFYLPMFGASPFILVGQAFITRFGEAPAISAVLDLLGRVRSTTQFSNFFISKFFEFSSFGILNAYTSRIHSMEVGLNLEVSKFSGRAFDICRTSSDFRSTSIFYSLGLDTQAIKEMLTATRINVSQFVIYQGSHGNGIASEAHLVLPVLTYVESAMFYKNLLGSVKKSIAAISYNFSAKTNADVFRLLLGALMRHKAFTFSTLNFYLSVSFNRSLLLSHEYLLSSAFLLPWTSSAISPQESACSANIDYFYIRTYQSFFIIEKNRILQSEFLVFYKRLLSVPPVKVISAPLSSVILNYYGDPNLVLVSASRTMNLCSNLMLKRNFSFAKMYS